MQVYIIGSPRIQIAKMHKKTLGKCTYDQQEMLDYFQHNQLMKVFNSLEDAMLYVEATRQDVRNSPFAISAMHAYPVYKVEISDDIVLNAYQVKQEKSNFTFDSRFQNKLTKDENKEFYLLPAYYEVPANLVLRVSSVMDFYDENKEIDLLNLNHASHSKSCCII